MDALLAPAADSSDASPPASPAAGYGRRRPTAPGAPPSSTRGRLPALGASRIPGRLPGRPGSVGSVHLGDRAEEVQALDPVGGARRRASGHRHPGRPSSSRSSSGCSAMRGRRCPDRGRDRRGRGRRALRRGVADGRLRQVRRRPRPRSSATRFSFPTARRSRRRAQGFIDSVEDYQLTVRVVETARTIRSRSRRRRRTTASSTPTATRPRSRVAYEDHYVYSRRSVRRRLGDQRTTVNAAELNRQTRARSRRRPMLVDGPAERRDRATLLAGSIPKTAASPASKSPTRPRAAQFACALGRVVQERAGEVTERLGDGRGLLGGDRLRREPRQLAVEGVEHVGPQRDDGGRRRLLGGEGSCGGGDELACGRVGRELRQSRVRGDELEIHQLDAGQLADGRVDVPRQSEVDDRPAGLVGDVVDGHRVRVRAGDDDVGGGDGIAEVVLGADAVPLGELLRAAGERVDGELGDARGCAAPRRSSPRSCPCRRSAPASAASR